MDRALCIRACSLYLPLATAAALWCARPPLARRRRGILLATAWNLFALQAVNRAAIGAGLWAFDFTGGGFGGMPVDLWIGWVVLWSVLPAFLQAQRPALVAAAFVALDLILMPLCAPVVRLQQGWLVGELVAIAIALVPSLLLARWTESGERLRERALLLVCCFAGIFLFLLPSAILELTGGTWSIMLRRPAWLRSSLAQALAAAGALGLSAVLEFESRGGGTPLPFDPPRRLVTSGLYAFVANPMQIAVTLCLALMGIGAGSAWLCGAAVMSVVYSAGLARLDEGEDLRDRFRESFLAYRGAVRDWFPRLRPYAADGAGSVLFVATECGKCSEIAAWFRRRRLTGLAIVPAESSPLGDLLRVTYLAADGTRAEGVEAVARALEHLHLGWALLGALARLPLLLPFLQLLTDASGGGPLLVRARGDVGLPLQHVTHHSGSVPPGRKSPTRDQ